MLHTHVPQTHASIPTRPIRYTVIDKTGVILYVNDAMCRKFGRDREHMLGENVRILMPEPYNSQHDHFLKRHLKCGIRNIIGTERAVPILRADGTQAIVQLSIQERVDPGSRHNRLFVGMMKFAVTDCQMPAFRNMIQKKSTDLQQVIRRQTPCLTLGTTGTQVLIPYRRCT